MDSQISDPNSNIIQEVIAKICSKVSDDVFGHEKFTKLLAGAFVIGGHVLLEGPPGIAKTLLARKFAKSMGLRFNRIQFTPDLMPSDVTGVYIFDQASSSFRLSLGPIFADILFADEINRTPPKTQSALLEAMQERFVTIDGKRHSLGDKFFVIATQNPVEHEGTYPLPEAQLDRFLFKLNMSYPGADFETPMIKEMSALPLEIEQEIETSQDQGVSGVVSIAQLDQARTALRDIRLDDSIADYIQRIATATREHPDLMLGASPRAALNLALAAKLNAALDGRNYVIPDDVSEMCSFVLGHRLIYHPEFYAESDSASKTLTEILARVSVPDGSFA